MDEVGRGPLAGPVVVGIVLVPKEGLKLAREIAARDSKILSPKRREVLSKQIRASYPWAVGICTARMIDRFGISWALRYAVRRAGKALERKPDYVLADYGLSIAELEVEGENMVGGDGKIFSVACASIVAKVWRDDWMRRQARRYPEYAFEKHKGYGTRAHYAALAKYGTCPLHRMSYGLEKFAK